MLSLLIPAFSLVYCPHRLPLVLLPIHIAPLPIVTVTSMSRSSLLGFWHLLIRFAAEAILPPLNTEVTVTIPKLRWYA